LSPRALRNFDGEWIAQDRKGEVVAHAPNAKDLATSLERLGREKDPDVSIRRVPKTRTRKLLV